MTIGFMIERIVAQDTIHTGYKTYDAYMKYKEMGAVATEQEAKAIVEAGGIHTSTKIGKGLNVYRYHPIKEFTHKGAIK